jgi:hypothetical protein
VEIPICYLGFLLNHGDVAGSFLRREVLGVGSAPSTRQDFSLILVPGPIPFCYLQNPNIDRIENLRK